MGFDFRWIEWNLAKIAAHGVTTGECEWVVQRVKPSRSGEKYIASGRTMAGRRIRVIYVVDDPITMFVIPAYAV